MEEVLVLFYLSHISKLILENSLDFVIHFFKNVIVIYCDIMIMIVIKSLKNKNLFFIYLIS